MIRVGYDEEKLEMRIAGHAGSAQYGHDLVCAAASILTLTLEETLRRACALGAESTKEPGYAKICSFAEGKDAERARAMYGAIFTGYELLEERYPEFIKTERTGERRKI